MQSKNSADDMKQLFLTSSVHTVAHDVVKRVDLSLGNKLVFIITASEVEDGDKTWLANDRQSLVDAGFAVTDYTITGKTKEQLAKDLEVFDYLYLSGGNTLYLLQQSQKTGFFSLIQDLVNNKGKTYIGTSAGSIIAGEKCPDYLLENNETLEIENMDGYGFVNFTILPHWGSEVFKEKYLSQRLAIAYRTNQVPLLLLTDNQYVHVQGDQVEIIDLLEHTHE